MPTRNKRKLRNQQRNQQRKPKEATINETTDDRQSIGAIVDTGSDVETTPNYQIPTIVELGPSDPSDPKLIIDEFSNGTVRIKNLGQLTKHTIYRVESPKPIKPKEISIPKLLSIGKSRSLDDDDGAGKFSILEMSDTSVSIDMDGNTPIVSEAESEYDLSECKSYDSLTVEPIEYDPIEIALASETIHNELHRPETIDQLPLLVATDKYLDVIREECSDASDAERSNSQWDEELEDDVFVDNDKMTRTKSASFPRINLDFTQKRKHASHLKLPATMPIREEPTTKLVEPDLIEMGTKKIDQPIDLESIEESCEMVDDNLELIQSNEKFDQLSDDHRSTTDENIDLLFDREKIDAIVSDQQSTTECPELNDQLIDNQSKTEVHLHDHQLIIESDETNDENIDLSIDHQSNAKVHLQDLECDEINNKNIDLSIGCQSNTEHHVEDDKSIIEIDENIELSIDHQPKTELHVEDHQLIIKTDEVNDEKIELSIDHQSDEISDENIDLSIGCQSNTELHAEDHKSITEIDETIDLSIDDQPKTELNAEDHQSIIKSDEVSDEKIDFSIDQQSKVEVEMKIDENLDPPVVDHQPIIDIIDNHRLTTDVDENTVKNLAVDGIDETIDQIISQKMTDVDSIDENCKENNEMIDHQINDDIKNKTIEQSCEITDQQLLSDQHPLVDDEHMDTVEITIDENSLPADNTAPDSNYPNKQDNDQQTDQLIECTNTLNAQQVPSDVVAAPVGNAHTKPKYTDDVSGTDDHELTRNNCDRGNTEFDNSHSDSPFNSVNTIEFNIGEPCSCTMFGNCVDNSQLKSVTVKMNCESLSQPSSIGSGSTSKSTTSQCTAQYNRSVGDIMDFLQENSTRYKELNGSFIKSLRQLCVERLSNMKCGDLVLEELAKVAESLTDLTTRHHQQHFVRYDDNKIEPKVIHHRIERSPTPPPVPALPKSYFTDSEPPSSINQNRIMNETCDVNDQQEKTIKATDDTNRLLAIIRGTNQSPPPVINRNENVVDSGENTSSLSSVPGPIGDRDREMDYRRPSKLQPINEIETYETKKRIEGGNIIFEFSDPEKPVATKPTVIASSKLEQNGVTASTKNNYYETFNEKCINRSGENYDRRHEIHFSGNHTAPTIPRLRPKSECFDDPFKFPEFDSFFNRFSRDRTNLIHCPFTQSEQALNHEIKIESPNESRSPLKTPDYVSNLEERYKRSVQDFHRSMQNLNEITRNITKPIEREENLCKGFTHSTVPIRAPRITTPPPTIDHRRYEPKVTIDPTVRQSMIDQTPITRYVSTNRRSLGENQLDMIRKKERTLHDEFEKLEQDRRRLMEEIEQMQVNQAFDSFIVDHKNRSTTEPRRQSATEVRQQQIHNEWMDKMAEREERRAHKLIKITNSTDDRTEPRRLSGPIDVGDEFLNRVRERRSKLKMPADSDWESGSESQPQPRKDSDQPVDPTIKVIDGETEKDLTGMPKHLKEFATYATSTERREFSEYRNHTERMSSTTDEIWTPNSKKSSSNITSINQSSNEPPQPPPPPVWTPTSTEPSPTFDRKGYKPVKFESPTLNRKVYSQQSSTDAQPPWSYSSGSTPNLNINKPVTPNTPSTPTRSDYQLFRSASTNLDTNQRKAVNFTRSNDALYSNQNRSYDQMLIDQERMSRQISDLSRQKITDIGPTTKDGMPIVLRSEVDENNQHKWYKKMYNTLHKVRDDDDYVTVRYKTRRGRYPYKTNGYMSEPEPNYDSDYSIKSYGTMPHPSRSAFGMYRNNPGKIEDYVPGYYPTDKARKEQVEQEKLVRRRYAEGNLSRALKDQGYESDSTLVFRKKDTTDSLSPNEQKQAYLSLQAGGDVPVQGFRKIAPEKPKDEMADKYREFMDKLLDPRWAAKEIVCYPITNITKPIDLFGDFPKHVQTFIPVPPPTPPNRKSSKQNHTLMLITEMQMDSKKKCSARKVTQDTSIRSKSAETFNETIKDATKNTVRSRFVKSAVHQRVSSLSPIGRPSKLPIRKLTSSPIAFGRSISKERTFAEEKKRLEQKLPVCKKLIPAASTSILRDPNVKSPDQVKKAVQAKFRQPTSSLKITATRNVTANYPNGSVRSAAITYTENKTLKPKPRVNKPVVVSSNTSKTRYSEICTKNRQSYKSASNLSLARTNSTFSIDSVTSEQKRCRTKPVTITKRKTKPKEIINSKIKPTEVKCVTKTVQNPLKSDRFFQNLFLRDVPTDVIQRSNPTQKEIVTKSKFNENVTKQTESDSLSDEEEEFGDYYTSKLTRKYCETRSLSEPPKLYYSGDFNDHQQIDVSLKCQEIRSPSCRRIQSFRSDRQRVTNSDHLRSRSFGPGDRSYENHKALCSHRQSERFKDLNQFYARLERYGELERATSSKDVRPVRKTGEVIDFDVWKRYRETDRAEKERNYLRSKLRKDQEEKDFLFRARFPEDTKWTDTADSGLRIKEKSVEDIKEIFEDVTIQEQLDEVRKQQIEATKDTYKPLWRGHSVLDLATTMETKYSVEKKPKRFELSSKLISTLSKDQIGKIKNQLSQIYNQNIGKGKAIVDHAKYVVEVGPTDKPKTPLIVRSNSVIGRKQYHSPDLRDIKKDRTEVSTIRLSRSAERYQPIQPVSEDEKRKFFQALSREMIDKINERRNRQSEVVLAKETRGAIASEIARESLQESQPQHRACYSLEYSATKVDNTVAGDSSNVRSLPYIQTSRPTEQYESIGECSVQITAVEPTVKRKINFFENKKDDIAETTIYHAREYSSPDEEEIMKIVSENVRARREKSIERQIGSGLSSSVSDFKEIFGETQQTYPIKPRGRSPARSVSCSTSHESVFRSRSQSPISDKNWKTYLNYVKTGDVQKIKEKFEHLSERSGPIRRVRSNPEISKNPFHRAFSPTDVSWLTHKFETSESVRGRSRHRKTTSPILRSPIRDRLMPHINIISKIAELKRQVERSRSRSPPPKWRTGDVEKIRSKFEEEQSLLGQMYTSSPDIRELKDITNYLTGSWVAHQYPRRLDNARSPVSPERSPQSELVRKRSIRRPNSASPPRRPLNVQSILKPFYDIFHRDDRAKDVTARFAGDRKQIEAEYLWRRLLQRSNGYKKQIKFKESEVVPPPPPLKGVPMNVTDNGPESPHRYVERDVNIHYKSPVRYEYKEPLSDIDLAIRQAEQMKRVYEDERRRKQQLEQQQQQRWRHTDFFTPAQKSPISLHRYDDFGSDYSPKSPTTSRTVARALYNFHGQTAKELTFKKGDVIYIRRVIDKNWYEGEHNAMIGLLPVNYVEIISKDGYQLTPKKPVDGQGRAKYNFQAQSAIELSLNKGELVTLTRRVDENWFEGKIANRKGIFPVTYVEVLTDIGADKLPITTKPIGAPAAHSLITPPPQDYHLPNSNSVNEINTVPNQNGYESKSFKKTEVLHVETNNEPVAYRAIYKYIPQNSDELDLLEGDIVFVLEKCDDGWFVGTSQRTGNFGTFPGNYVERV